MPVSLQLEFVPFSKPVIGVLIVFCEDGLKFGPAARAALQPAGDLVTRAAAATRFKGKNAAILDIPAPGGLAASRLIVVGAGKGRDLAPVDFVKLGGVAMGQVSAAAEATILTDLPGGAVKPERAADLALGVRLRAYAFDRYKTRRKDEDERPKEVKVAIAVANVPATQKAYAARAAVADGVVIARDLINEPANVLYPEEFARRAANLDVLAAIATE